MIRKRYITLIELLISLGLTILLLTTLMGFYYQTTVAQKRIEESIQANFSALYSHYRLAKVFPTIERLFYTDNDSLVFIFDNGTGKEPLFSVDVLARLRLMENGDLMLFTWPTPKTYPQEDPPMRKELLHTGIQEMRTRFLKEGLTEVVNEWPFDEPKLPLIVWLDLITQKGEKLEFAFVLPKAGHPVLEGE